MNNIAQKKKIAKPLLIIGILVILVGIALNCLCVLTRYTMGNIYGADFYTDTQCAIADVSYNVSVLCLILSCGIGFAFYTAGAILIITSRYYSSLRDENEKNN